jgi:hypothetical protein
VKKGTAVFLRKSDAKLGYLVMTLADKVLWFATCEDGDKQETVTRFYFSKYISLGEL